MSSYFLLCRLLLSYGSKSVIVKEPGCRHEDAFALDDDCMNLSCLALNSLYLALESAFVCLWDVCYAVGHRAMTSKTIAVCKRFIAFRLNTSQSLMTAVTWCQESS
jgi:hypothetical protein